MSRSWPERGGLLLAALGFTAVAFEVHRLGSDLWGGAADGRIWATAAVGAALYGGVGFLLAEAWGRWVAAFSGREVPRVAIYRVYGRTQIAKYLPGNVLHLVGRHVASRGWGIGHADLVRAAAAETVTLVLCAGALGGALVLRADRFQDLPLLRFAAVWSVAIALAAVLWFRRGSDPHAAAPVRPLWPAAAVAGLAALGFFSFGGILLALLVRAAGAGSFPFPLALSVWAIAWMAGFVVPGAPAGLGVREWVLLSLSGSLVEAEPLLLAILALRVLTVAGDGLFVLYVGLLPPVAEGFGPPTDC